MVRSTPVSRRISALHCAMAKKRPMQTARIKIISMGDAEVGKVSFLLKKICRTNDFVILELSNKTILRKAVCIQVHGNNRN